MSIIYSYYFDGVFFSWHSHSAHFHFLFTNPLLFFLFLFLLRGPLSLLLDNVSTNPPERVLSQRENYYNKLWGGCHEGQRRGLCRRGGWCVSLRDINDHNIEEITEISHSLSLPLRMWEDVGVGHAREGKRHLKKKFSTLPLYIHWFIDILFICYLCSM